MDTGNKTTLTQFVLLSFSTFPQIEVILFIVILLMYITCISGNFAIIVLVKIRPSLHTPMYFFISVFSALEIMFISVTIPKLLSSLISAKRVFSFVNCFTQLYFFNAFGVTECYLLTVMAFDRDLAINNPLRYGSLMNPNVCIQLSILPWISGFTIGLIPIIFTSSLEFCRSNEVDHFFCDLSALQNLSCSNTFGSNVVTSIITVFAGLIPFSAIMLIYIHIIITISKIKCNEGKKKAFSTCSSHLIVTSLFYGTVIIMYIRPRFTEYDKFIALIYTVIIPFLNPFIYTLRNKEVKVVLIKPNF
ncbi:olfactory receptor 5AN1-like [Pyxicephalus adspersus]|uniref:olfactory receptor 5AN1-like n=1 Tax=Pyxicephalus adspersus TaxID=30357 RepID=UPI003B5CE6FB